MARAPRGRPARGVSRRAKNLGDVRDLRGEGRALADEVPLPIFIGINSVGKSGACGVEVVYGSIPPQTNLLLQEKELGFRRVQPAL